MTRGYFIAAVFALAFSAPVMGQEQYPVPISDIRCGDPFIYADPTDSTYYMYSTGSEGRVLSRASKDLENWGEPFEVMRFTDEHWAGSNAASWAAEMHYYKGKYWLFTTSHTDYALENIPGRGDIPHRATQIYVSDSPRGPFRDFTSNKPHTPWEWPALDGTLWVEDGVPYMVFCHEWLQIEDGTMEAVRLPDDLGVPQEKPFTLFKGSDAKWASETPDSDGSKRTVFVTDGPWLFRTQTGRLGMLWSTYGPKGYAITVAYSESGSVKGPWIQEDKPLFDDNGGHGMLFRSFDGQLKISFHRWSDDADKSKEIRYPVIRDVDDSGDKLVLLPEGE